MIRVSTVFPWLKTRFPWLYFFFFFFSPSGCEALIHVVVLTYKWRQTAFHEKID